MDIFIVVILLIYSEALASIQFHVGIGFRSGRTGRAGKTGISIVLVDRKHEGQISVIQRQAGVKFERIGAPQPEDMAKVAADNAAADLTRVEKDIIAMFRCVTMLAMIC